VSAIREQVVPGIHRLSRGVANVYLVEEGGKLLLVDAGAPADWSLFAATVKSLGRAVEDLDAVLLTHARSDHTAARLARDAGPPS
jgi:glyoxylase-like metal-dependent hydrolase (beta-lactamase superfamily II)